MNKILQGEKLVSRAKELGVDIKGEPRTQSTSGNSPKASDHELQRRVIEAERSIRENRLWIIAVIAAVVSVVSAIIALIAVASN